MSSATFYFGVPPANSKSASEGARKLGLNLLRASPSEVNPVTVCAYQQPGHSVYKDFMAVFIQAAKTGNTYSTRSPPYHELSNKSVPSVMRLPELTWSYNTSINAEKSAEIIASIPGARETSINNRKGFEMTITKDSFDKMMAFHLKPNALAPTGTQHVNISGFQQFLFLNRLLDAFCRTNQYPGFKTNSREDIGWSQLSTMIDGSEKVDEIEYSEVGIRDIERPFRLMNLKHNGDKAKVKRIQASYLDSNYLIFANNTTKFADFKYEYSNVNDLPTGFTYMFFPYEDVLTKTDFSVVPRVIQRYFMGTLAVSSGVAQMRFLDVKSNWGNLCKTRWGDILAHQYRCMELALATQTSLRLWTVNGVYRGCLLVGGLYSLLYDEKAYEPVDRDEIIKQIKTATPHAASLDWIFQNIAYSSVQERNNAKAAVTSIRDINRQITTHGILESSRNEMRTRAYHLDFPGDGEYLTPTAYNISRVMNAIGDSSISLTLPIHPEAIDSPFVEEQLLSSFGALVPTFMVANGKKMSLEGNFSIRGRNSKGDLEDTNVTKIACALAPLKIAYEDFKKMKDQKAVFNPFGSQIGASNANKAINRAFEKESAASIIASLRKAVGASAVVKENSKKRKAEEALEGSARGGAFAFDF